MTKEAAASETEQRLRRTTTGVLLITALCSASAVMFFLESTAALAIPVLLLVLAALPGATITFSRRLGERLALSVLVLFPVAFVLLPLVFDALGLTRNFTNPSYLALLAAAAAAFFISNLPNATRLVIEAAAVYLIGACFLILFSFSRGFQPGEATAGRLDLANPNLIGISLGAGVVAASAFPSDYGTRFFTVLRAIFVPTGLVLIWMTKSRGTILALVATLVLMAALSWAMRIQARRATAVRPVLAVLGLAAALTGCWLARIDLMATVAVPVAEQLDLLSEHRGVSSGMSGRTDNWKDAVDSLRGLRLISGTGFRSSGAEYPIDNSYLVLALEMGLISTALFLLLTAAVLGWYTLACFTHRGTAQQEVFALCALFTFLLINNFVARYYPSSGNPAGILSLLLLFLINNQPLRLRRPAGEAALS